MTDTPDLTLMLRAERNGADVPLAEGLAGLSEEMALTLAVEVARRADIRVPVAIEVLVSDDAALRRLNHDYRGRDEATDVLSFPQLEAPLAHAPAEQLWGASEEDGEALRALAVRNAALGTLAANGRGEPWNVDDTDGPLQFTAPPDLPLPLGDIVISRDAVLRQAATAGHSAAWEMAFLLAHGILHLVGYDDHTEAGYAAMVAHQEAALSAVGLSKD